MIRRLFYSWQYLFGTAPWDTGITPPEIVALIEEERLPPGRAIDLGCGTGTNVIYLAQHGWQATGIDYIRRAIRIARRRAHRAGVAARTHFIHGDVTRLTAINPGKFDLAIDIGCGHGLPLRARPAYADGLARIVRPGGVLMLYMFRPTPSRPMGMEPEAVEQLFTPAFRLVWSSVGKDTAAGTPSAWYRFERSLSE